MGNHLKRVMVPVRGDLLETVHNTGVTIADDDLKRHLAYAVRHVPIGTLLMVTPTEAHPHGFAQRSHNKVQVHVLDPERGLKGWVCMRNVKIVQRTTENIRRKKRASF
jgi:hypothetical protein